MSGRINARVAAACACVLVGLVVAEALVRKAGSSPPARDLGREAFLDDRRARMQRMREALLARDDGAA